jgi:hypothetical protein
MGKFAAQVDSWVRQTQKRMVAVRNRAVELTIEDAQKPRAKGGRMRVDTGFLRASGQMSLGGMPTGPSRPADDAKPFQYDDGNRVTPVTLILVQASLETKVFFGWTANYARPREAKDAFLRLAVQKWPDFVAQSTQEAKTRVASKK